MVSCLWWRETLSGFLQVSIHQEWGVFSVSSPSWKTTTPVHQTNNGPDLIIWVKMVVLLAPILFSLFVGMNLLWGEPGKLSYQTNDSSNYRQGHRTILLSRFHKLRKTFVVFWETTYLTYCTPVVSVAQCQQEMPCSLFFSHSTNFITTEWSNKIFLTKEKPNQYLLKKSSAKGFITTIVFLEISRKLHKYFTCLFSEQN